MALFGFAEVEAPYLVRHKSGAASVTLTLTDGEHAYELARSFRRKTRRGREVFEPEEPSFRVDGELRTYSATEFRQRVIELLGFPDNPNPRSRSDLWRWAVYTPQERMREILREDEADARLETIRKALGLERYRLAADNAEMVATALRTRARTHLDVARGLQHFEGDLAKAEADLTAATSLLADTEGRAAESRRLASEAEELLTASEAGRRAREADQRELEQRLVERDRLEGALVATARRLAESRVEADERQKAVDALDDLGPRLAEAHRLASEAQSAWERSRAELERLEDAAREKASSENAVAGLRNGLKDLDRTTEQDRKELLRAEEEAAEALRLGPAKEPSPPTPRTMDEVAASIASLRTEEQALLRDSSLRDRERGELSALIQGKTCPRCHQAVRPDEFASHLAEAEQAARTTAEALREVQSRIATAEAERASRERFERVHQSWRSRQELRDRATAAVVRASGRVSADETARSELTGRLSEAEVLEQFATERAAPFAAARAGMVEQERTRERTRATLVDLERQDATAESLRKALETSVAHARAESERHAEDQRRLAEVRRDLDRLQTDLRGVAEANRAHAELLAGRDAARRAEQTANDALAGARERRTFAEERHTAARKGVAERREHLDRSERFQAIATFVATPYRDALLDLERRLLGRAQATFERSFSRAFSSLVEDPGLLARCGPSFVPFVEIDGEWTPAEALSGGERTALALAFRVALGDVVRASGRLRLDTIVLDEPTDGFSPEQVARMGELLRSLPWGQVVVVTHEASLAGVADRTVRVVKVGGISHLTGSDDASAPLPAPTRRRRSPRLDPVAPPST
jgi:exonuclease SbcC